MGNFPLLYVVKMSYIGGWVVQKSLKTPLRNIKMAPNQLHKMLYRVSEGKVVFLIGLWEKEMYKLDYIWR